MAQENYNYSGSFEIEECELRTHHGNKVDLSSGQVIIGVYEDIMPVSYTHLTLPTKSTV